MIQFTIPDNGLTAAVSATNTNGTATSPATLKVRPTVDPLYPYEGYVGAVIPVTGKTFVGVTSVKVGGVPAAFVVLSPTLMKVTVPLAAVTGPVSVTTPGGTTMTVNNWIMDPKITSFTPTSGAVGTTVTVLGTGFTGA